MLLRHVGEPDAATAVEEAVGGVLVRGVTRTPDLGGSSRTGEVGDAVCALLEGAASR
jgi:tartrate dehydrogenase/decarboxylase/D-malate dehydrogenase